jgi:glyoxylase-like metal-dependent hydrolase (beta-lactamase superfamily II)
MSGAFPGAYLLHLPEGGLCKLNSPLLPDWVKKLTVGPYATNSYLIFDGDQCLIIDPGGDGETISQALEEGVKSMQIFLTHGHADHWAGLAELEELFPEARIFYPEKDEIFFKKPNLHFLHFLGGKVPNNLGQALHPPYELRVGNLSFSLIHLPGHTPGHLALLGHGLLFSGDVVFMEGVGRTDFPGGSPEELRSSLKMIWSLPPETVICPGHGPLTTVREVKTYLEL